MRIQSRRKKKQQISSRENRDQDKIRSLVKKLVFHAKAARRLPPSSSRVSSHPSSEPSAPASFKFKLCWSALEPAPDREPLSGTGVAAVVVHVLLLRPLNAKGKLRRRERAPFEPKFSS